MTKTIAIYIDLAGRKQPARLGLLRGRLSAGRETFDLELDPDALLDKELEALHLDPRIVMALGHQYPPTGSPNFGAFADASPDRWGRMLMQRRLERDKRTGRAPPTQRLLESDYLLGVHDQFRVGALRFRLNDRGDFLDDRHDVAAPPFVQLRALEAACLALEADPDDERDESGAWLDLLIAPGGSLGGARPKASVVDPAGKLWIAKFPSVRDDRNVGAWELITQTLARAAGIRVPAGQAKRFGSKHHTFLISRFDRDDRGGRIHFASAMTLTGHQDGDDASTGASYLELVDVLIKHGALPHDDLHELWKRIVFNMLVCNTDDHLRNHGFTWIRNKGWRLSEAFDMNPVPESTGLRLNVSEADNAIDLQLALSVASLFRVDRKQGPAMIADLKQVVGQWRTLANELGIPRREQEAMAPAFRLADET